MVGVAEPLSHAFAGLASKLDKLCVCLQGIDLEAGGRNKKTARTAPKSDNVYLKLLVKVGWSSSNSTKPSCPCCLPAVSLPCSCTGSW